MEFEGKVLHFLALVFPWLGALLFIVSPFSALHRKSDPTRL